MAHGRHTIYEVAAAAGVSIATVSRVLSTPAVVAAATRERVLAAIDELNYVPAGAARSLAARHNEAFALALPELRGPYYAELLSGFEAAAAERGASVVLLLTRGKPGVDETLRRLAGRVDAMAVLDGVETGPATLEALRRKIPVVTIAGSPGLPTSLVTENVGSAAQLTGHLLDAHSRTRLRFVGDPASAADIAARHAGFLAAHADRRRTPADPIPCAPIEREGSRIADLVAGGRLPADALVCANDELALAAMQGLTRRGISVPGDIAVTGWDDMLAARFVTPGLTTVRQPVRRLAAVAVDAMSTLLRDAAPPAVCAPLPTTVVLRQSCGCP